MRKVQFGTLIDKSVSRVMFVLFKPFSLKKWLCLLFIAWLAGALGGGNFNAGNYGPDKDEKNAETVSEDSTSREKTAEYSQEAPQSDFVRDLSPAGEKPQKGVASRQGFFRGKSRNQIILIIAAVAIGFILFAAFLVFIAWITSRFKFIWFNAIVSNDASIVGPFNRFKKEGNSLFIFFLAWSVLYLVLLGFIIFWAYSSGASAGFFGQDPKVTFSGLIGAFLLPALIVFLMILVSLAVMTIVDQFVVPIMAIDGCRFKTAWDKALSIIKSNAKDCLLYFLLLIGLGILCGVMAIFAMFLVVLLLLLAAGIVAGLLYLLTVTLFGAQALFYALAILIGLPFLTAAILILLALNLPFAVFFKNLSLYFLSSLECGYTPLPLESEESQGPEKVNV
jgi:hypothetical protein